MCPPSPNCLRYGGGITAVAANTGVVGETGYPQLTVDNVGGGSTYPGGGWLFSHPSLYPQLTVDNVGGGSTYPGGGWLFSHPSLCVNLLLAPVGVSYPQADLVIHRKRGVIHRRGAGRAALRLWCPPDVGDVGTRRPGLADVDIGGRAVESEVTRLLAVVVEPLTQGDDLASEVCILLDQIGDALTTVENGGVIAPP